MQTMKKHPGEKAMELVIMIGPGGDVPEELHEAEPEDDGGMPRLLRAQEEPPMDEMGDEMAPEDEDALVNLLRKRRAV